MPLDASLAFEKSGNGFLHGSLFLCLLRHTARACVSRDDHGYNPHRRLDSLLAIGFLYLCLFVGVHLTRASTAA